MREMLLFFVSSFVCSLLFSFVGDDGELEAQNS